ncbi:hypothetical protein NPIL_463851 [Nephila pilipes]|uniref:Uncharacterized protein n=1 Tax=Nephila pilipes TaxID=299642 RepID=A0A8X6MMV6_NEPPI|nr:hypothetical protein NPIL_463851 [Nephila pilipes]
MRPHFINRLELQNGINDCPLSTCIEFFLAVKRSCIMRVKMANNLCDLSNQNDLDEVMRILLGANSSNEIDSDDETNTDIFLKYMWEKGRREAE